MKKYPTCEAIRINDEYQCARCGFCWDIKDEDPPKCKTASEHGRDRLDAIRRKVFGDSGHE